MKPQLKQPIVCHGQSDPDYRAAKGLSQSAMKELLISPAHFLARYGPDAEPFFPSKAMTDGTAIHHKVLEPDTFDATYINKGEKPKEPTVPEMKALCKESGHDVPSGAKKADLELLLWPEGKPKDRRKALDADTWRMVNNAAAALRTHDIAGDWFCPGATDYRKHNEVSVYVKHENGQILKGRFDRLDTSGEVIRILDLKTTVNASPREFQRSVVNYSYDLQAAWYMNLARRAFPGRPVEFYFVALERKAPYGISVFKASDNLLHSGQVKMDRALDTYCQCEALNYWPSYEPVVHDLDLPPWAVAKETDAAHEEALI